LFDGRTAEDFKLASGTWVSVGPMRARLVEHLAPLAKDVVIAAPDRDEIGILIFPDIEACRHLAADLPASAPVDSVIHHPKVTAELRARLNSFAKQATGGSTRVCRAHILTEPPSLDAGEITDKGSLNQRMVLRHRADVVDELYADPPSPRVATIDRSMRA
jgi:feruloyl-CoA synthase